VLHSSEPDFFDDEETSLLQELADTCHSRWNTKKSCMPRLELYPFRYRHPLTGKWIRARYKAELHEIAERYAEYEITGPPEIREVDPKARHFNPFRREDAP
jgi:hypothetical protein